MKAFSPEQLGIVSQPLDSTEIGRRMMDNRAALIAIVMSGRATVPLERYFALAKPEPVHPLPNDGRILPAVYYGEGERQ